MRDWDNLGQLTQDQKPDVHKNEPSENLSLNVGKKASKDFFSQESKVVILIF